MRRLTQVGVALAIGAMVVAAYAFYQLLHFETCLSSNVAGKAVECTKHIADDEYLLAGAVTAAIVGLIIANAMFRLLFPLFWAIMGAGALLAAATSSTTLSPGVEGAPGPVAHLHNVSRTVGFEIGGMFVAIGVLLYVVFWGVGMASRGLRRAVDSFEQAGQPSAGASGAGFGGPLGAVERAAVGRIEQAALAGTAPPPGAVPPAVAPGVAPTGSPSVGLTPELRAAMLASARHALDAVKDPATRKLLIDQYRMAGLPIDEAGNPTD